LRRIGATFAASFAEIIRGLVDREILREGDGGGRSTSYALAALED
jgi:hypothetical protein